MRSLQRKKIEHLYNKTELEENKKQFANLYPSLGDISKFEVIFSIKRRYRVGDDCQSIGLKLVSGLIIPYFNAWFSYDRLKQIKQSAKFKKMTLTKFQNDGLFRKKKDKIVFRKNGFVYHN